MGIVTDVGLNIMAEKLVSNTSLIKLEFSEIDSEPWSEDAKKNFASMLQNSTELEKIKFATFDEER